MPKFLSSIWTSIIEYETPRLVRIHNRKLGLVRRLIQFSIVCYVLVYALWLQQGYQEFTRVESSVTVKIKGVTKSELGGGTDLDPSLYTRVWDVADYVVPPAENGAFFVATNVIITANQTRGVCPEDHIDVRNVTCIPDLHNCIGNHRCTPERKGEDDLCPKGKTIFKAHGPLTGYCVPSDRPSAANGTYACEVESWCPIEVDSLPLGKDQALMQKAEDYTVFIKNSMAFPYFGEEYARNNLIGNNRRPCMFKVNAKKENNGCQIFRLGDMVQLAGGNFSRMAIKGGVISVSIKWNCNLDRDFMRYCLPHYGFRILDEDGWNFRHAKYHEEHRRSLFKMYGIKFIVTVEGRGGKFNLKNTILNIGSGLALLGVSTVVCDFLLMYIKEKGVVKKKKYDYIDVEELLASREEARRKLQQSQLRRRNLMTNLSRRWRRSTMSNSSNRSENNQNSQLPKQDTISSLPPMKCNNSRSYDNTPMMMKDSISSTTMLGIPNVINSNGSLVTVQPETLHSPNNPIHL